MDALSLLRLHGHESFNFFVESLWLAAFPPAERRPLAEQRKNFENNKNFFGNVILHQGKPAGLITWWDMDDFIYCEHFAIAASLRSLGMGKQVISRALKLTARPMLLEVERPGLPQTDRRIRFYESCGFQLWDYDYLQPPYRPGGERIPMSIMATAHNWADKKQIIKKLHGMVYGWSG